LSWKESYKFVLLVVALMVIFPIITNSLMFVGNFKVAGNDVTWIGYLGSFWGAIIGGVISGAITLMGVRLTIENQKKDEFIRLYPQMMLLGDEITFEIDNFLNDLNIYNKDPKKRSNHVAFISKKFFSKCKELLNSSVKINGFVYENIRELHGQMHFFYEYITRSTDYSAYGEIIHELDEGEIQKYKNRIEAILKRHDAYMLEISNNFFELTFFERTPKKFRRFAKKILRKIKKIDGN
jgi:hypothetical protein